MKLLCEVITRDALPALRALIAKELLDSHKLTQQEVARLLDVTQPAISQYKRELRGFKVKVLQENKNIMGMIQQLSDSMAKKEVGKVQLMHEISKVCKAIVHEDIVFALDKSLHPDAKKLLDQSLALI
jgi:uncharacterized protein